MSRTLVVTLIYHHHKPIVLILAVGEPAFQSLILKKEAEYSSEMLVRIYYGYIA
jgi:hypothetical protein